MKLTLNKTADEPYCEHCNVLEIGSFMIEDGGTAWCLVCADANDYLPKKQSLETLLEAERLSRIAAHQNRIDELTLEEGL